jgi:acyl-CoA dehydrogenase
MCCWWKGVAGLQKSFEDFDQAIWGHSRFLFGNILRSFFLGLTRGRLSPSPVKGATAHYYRQLNWMSAAFALCADAAMMSLGGALKRKERLSARLGDILSELYLTSAVLKQHAEHQHTPDESPLVQWCCEQALYRMQECFRLLLRNLPWRPLAWVLRLLVFPTGLPYTEPKDHLDHQVAQVLLKPSATRDRLTAGIFMPQDPHYKQALLDQALEKTAALSAIEKTLRNARHAGLIKSKNIHQQLEEAVAGGLIHENDVQAMQELEKLREQIVAVDSFADYGQQAKEAI